MAFDDWLTLWVNGKTIGPTDIIKGVRQRPSRWIFVQGKNTIQIKLNNFDDQEHSAWDNNCAVEEDD